MEFPEVTTARRAFSTGKTLPLEFRRKQLLKLVEVFEDQKNRDNIYEAVYKDMRKCAYEVSITEVVGVLMEVKKILNNLEDFTATKTYPRRLLALGDRAFVRKEPHGVVLILGTWNYPFYITLLPLAGAIAAGNCVIIKPSEISHNSSELMLELISQSLDTDCYHVVLGDATRTKSLLTNRFDYIFFTGSTNVGKSILEMAAPNLTPVTLELGGKSPVYIDDSACSKMAVKRILWAKCINLGQTCVAPDYVICSQRVQDAFIRYAKEIFNEWYDGSENLQNVEKFSRIVNLNHFQRLKKLLDKTEGKILFGGKSDEKDLWIEPTFVGYVKRDDILMEGEIFGPILPIVTLDSADEAIQFINSTERPLALYIFSKDEEITRKMLEQTYSGGVCINDTIFQLSDLRLPFGGTGHSGMGQYHGRHSVDTFSHQRSVVKRGLNYLSEKLGELRYPPFTSSKMKILERVFLIMESTDVTLSPFWSHLVAIAFGIGVGILLASLGLF